MSDQTGQATLPSSLNLDEVRLEVLEAFAATRLKTTANISAAGTTLDGTQDEVRADCSGGSFSVLLPASPTEGDHYEFTNVGASGTLTVDRNGKTINGAGSNVTLSTQWSSKRITWNASANTWWWR